MRVWVSASNDARRRPALASTKIRTFVTAVGAGVFLAAASLTSAQATSAAEPVTAAETPKPAVVNTDVASLSSVSVNVGSAGEVPTAAKILEGDLKRFLDHRFDAPELARNPHEILQFGAMKVQRWVVDAVVRAAEATGVDPVYMMALADKESSFKTEVKAKTSSAEGLFQFVTQTWFEMVRNFGPRHGFLAEAAAIERLKGGKLRISDEAVRERVLGLRADPYIAGLMAAEMLKRDRRRIEEALGRELTHSECYIAHFLGAGSAGKLMKMVSGEPKMEASKAFPAAAKANKGIFYAKDGKKTRKLTVTEVYERLDQMIDTRLDRYEGVTGVASADPSF